MSVRYSSVRSVVKQWPRVIAESLRSRTEMCAGGACCILPDDRVWHGSPLGACWLGHATCLLRVGGLTILTDPHFESRAGVRVGPYTVGRRRINELPTSIDALPPVDVILLSHAHFDHWDRPTLTRLAKRFGVSSERPATVIVPARTRRLVPRGFQSVIELPWGEAIDGSGAGLKVSAIRPRHWGARWFIDRRRGYNSYLIEAGGRRVLFGGDTAHTDAFDHIGPGNGGGGVDLAVLGIGTYRHWEHAHATPEQAADMAARMGARLLMPIHHSTFKLDDEPVDEPMERLLKVWDAGRVVCARAGEVWAEGG
ncbi:MAG TPA: MBL fold metallo-hydrolase [Phycisphaerales bacterium]|nr:MBL fold metallo-hydrolase [Phycisphaerales bacterium]